MDVQYSLDMAMYDVRKPIPLNPTRFMDRLRAEMRRMGMSFHTERTYIAWIRRFIRFHDRKHPQDMGAKEIDEFLTYLAERRHVSINTQRLALNSLVFLYNKILRIEIGELKFRGAKRKYRAPVVFSHEEAMSIIDNLREPYKLMAEILYGSGLRMHECLVLRVKDLDFAQLQICVRDGKGNKDRFTLLPEPLIERLQQQIEAVNKLHQYDLARGFGEVYMPDALNRKYPTESKALSWQYLFPSIGLSVDPRSGIKRRHHAHHSTFAKNLRRATNKTGIRKRCTAHTFRHSFATRLLETGYDLKLIQSLMGHNDIRVTEIYLHVVRNRASSIKGPLSLGRELKEPHSSYQISRVA